MPRHYRRALAAFGILAVAGAALYGALWPLRLADSWQLLDTTPLSRPDSLALAADGSLLYVTLETLPGSLVRMTPDGPKTVFGEFGEPDGLLVEEHTAIVTEEEFPGRVMAYDLVANRMRVLARLEYPEDLLRRPDGSLVITEDYRDGRLMVLREGVEPQLLVDGIDQPEGLCNLPDGRIGIAESGRGRILAYGPAGLEVLADDLAGIDQLACGADGSLWAVLSRVRSGKLVRLRNGQRELIAQHLRGPQGIALAADGSVYIAETRADRVLRLKPR